MISIWPLWRRRCISCEFTADSCETLMMYWAKLLPVRLSHVSSSKRCVLELWLLYNANRKPHAGSRTHRSGWPCDDQKWQKHPRDVSSSTSRKPNEIQPCMISTEHGMWRHRLAGCLKDVTYSRLEYVTSLGCLHYIFYPPRLPIICSGRRYRLLTGKDRNMAILEGISFRCLLRSECFLPPTRRIRHCLSVRNFAQKLSNGFAWNFQEMLAMG